LLQTHFRTSHRQLPITLSGRVRTLFLKRQVALEPQASTIEGDASFPQKIAQRKVETCDYASDEWSRDQPRQPVRHRISKRYNGHGRRAMADSQTGNMLAGTGLHIRERGLTAQHCAGLAHGLRWNGLGLPRTTWEYSARGKHILVCTVGMLKSTQGPELAVCLSCSEALSGLAYAAAH
jgi:hypothetical protein